MGDPRSDGLLRAEKEGKFSIRSPDELNSTPEAASLLPEGKSGSDDGVGRDLRAEGKEREGAEEGPSQVFIVGKDLTYPGTPSDRCYMVYVIMLLHGVAVLMPWNMFINANEYFVDYKLRAAPGNGTGEDSAKLYRDYFLSFLGFVGIIPAIILNGLNLFCQCKSGNTTKRVVGGIIVIIIMFIITIALAIVDSSQWPGAFFWITMATVVVINMANGVYQNSIYGIAASLPMKYTNAVVMGSNISGVVTSLIAIASVAAAPDRRTSAVYYFLAAILILLVAVDMFFVLPLLTFYKYHSKAAKELKAESDGEEIQMSQVAVYFAVFKKSWLQLMGVFLTFFVTLSCFPAVQANIVRVDNNVLRVIMPLVLGPDCKPIKDYFPLVSCFLFFNFFAMMGNLLSGLTQKPGPRFTWLPIVARFGFLPFFMLSNFKPEERCLTGPPVISNDYVYLVGSILFAFSSGYFSSLSMMFAPRNVPVKHKGIAGMMAAFFLILGIFAGICFSFLVVYVIESLGSYCDPSVNLLGGGNVTAQPTCM